jgi:predicted MFS family arabinose efflux permease
MIDRIDNDDSSALDCGSRVDGQLQGVRVSTRESAGERIPGWLQGMTLLLPISMAVVGIAVFTATASLMTERFKEVPNGEYLVQLAITLPALWILLFSPIAGWLADLVGRRRILLVAMVAYALVGTAPFLLEDIYLILLTRCGVGICEAIVITVTTTMIGDYFKGAARERWLAAQTAIASFSSLLAIWAGGQLGAIFGWQGPFLLYAYSLVLAIGVALFTWEPTRNSLLEISAPEADVRFRTIPVKRMLGIGLVTVFASVMFYATITQNANALVALGVREPGTIGNLSAIASLGVPLGTLLFWGIARLRITWLLFFSFGLMGAGFAWMGMTTTAQGYAWAANLQQIGCGLVLPTLLVWATQGLAFDIRGRGTGIWQATFCIGQFVSGMTLTLVSKQLGGLFSTFSALSALCLSGALIAFLVALILARPPEPRGKIV